MQTLYRMEDGITWAERRAKAGGFTPVEMMPINLPVCNSPWIKMKAAIERFGYGFLMGTPSKTHYQIMVSKTNRTWFSFFCKKE